MKKSIVFLLFLSFGLSFAQTDYRSECRIDTAGINGAVEGFKVSFYLDLYGPRFNANDRCLTPELEKQIRVFLHRPYGASNRFTRGDNVIHIIKRDHKYYAYMPDSRPFLIEL